MTAALVAVDRTPHSTTSNEDARKGKLDEQISLLLVDDLLLDTAQSAARVQHRLVSPTLDCVDFSVRPR
jgi:hypothetical protein